MPHITMTWEEWVDRFKPITNHIEKGAPLDGFMFETYGNELEFVLKADPNKVWTLVDDGDNIEISEGWSYVNRMGYLITNQPAESGCTYSVDECVYPEHTEDEEQT